MCGACVWGGACGHDVQPEVGQCLKAGAHAFSFLSHAQTICMRGNMSQLIRSHPCEGEKRVCVVNGSVEVKAGSGGER